MCQHCCVSCLSVCMCVRLCVMAVCVYSVCCDRHGENMTEGVKECVSVRVCERLRVCVRLPVMQLAALI